jgi:two-component system NtrC family sensor kinase
MPARPPTWPRPRTPTHREAQLKLLPKFALLSFGVSAVPLAVAGLSATRISQEALRESIEDQEQLVALNVAAYVSTHVGNLLEVLRIETRVVHGGLPEGELLTKFLQLVYHQSDDFSAVFAVGERLQMLAPPAFQPNPRPQAALGAHDGATAKQVMAAANLVPVFDVLSQGAALGPVFPAGLRGNAHTVLAVKYDPNPEQPAKVVGAMVSLGRIAEYVAALAGQTRDIYVLDRVGRVVAASNVHGAPSFAVKPLPRTMPGTLPDHPWVLTYRSGERTVIGAYSAVEGFPFGVVVERPEREALLPVRRLGWTTVFWMSVSGFVAALVGAALARSLAGRVGALAEGARSISQGKLDTHLEVQSDDELGELAKAFNAMATSLDAARTEILRQTEEITSWNESLEKRVEEKTKELRDAQDLLLRSRSLAAIGSLGAGVAHEINNPLAGILGLSQLLLADLPEVHPARPMLQDLEEQAVRIQSIVGNLLRLSQRQAGEDFRPVDLSRIIDDALELCGPGLFAEAGITVERKVRSPSPLIRGSAPQLQAAIMQLVQNARGAMPAGGKLVVETALPEASLLRLRVSDTGRGIDPEHLPRIFDPFFTTKARRTDTGIGLSVVHKIIEDHGGKIRVESEPGHGTTFWITFPIDRGTSHLA